MGNNDALIQRLNRLRTELEVDKRRRTEEIQKIKSALSEIDKEDIELLDSVVPGLKVIVNYSIEDLRSNSNGELDNIKSVADTLRSFIEQRLSYYEEEVL